MKLGDFKRLNKQSFKQEFQELVEILGFIVNNDMEMLYNTLKRKVSLKDNIFCTVKEVPIIVNSNGIPKNITQFRLEDATMKVLGCQVINTINLDNSNTYPTGAPFINFVQNSGIVNISHITGLQADTTYLITVVAWGN